MENGFDPRATDASGYNALHTACSWGRSSIVRMLITKYEMNPRTKADNIRMTPLELAVCCGQIDVVKILVEEFGSGQESLEELRDLAIRKGHDDIADYLTTPLPDVKVAS